MNHPYSLDFPNENRDKDPDLVLFDKELQITGRGSSEPAASALIRQGKKGAQSQRTGRRGH
ncbi:hypothetical protein [Ahniella affigens]|uniref:hypothetical protein n=1 Tax=Ahniella affigens TaxID=2021234 RepID=UPI003CCD431D